MRNAFLIDSRTAGPIEHELTLKKLQESVGGFICPAFTIDSPDGDHELTGYVNDEGLLIGMPPTLRFNGQTFVGPCVIVGLNYDGDTIPLTQTDLDYLTSHVDKLAKVSRRDTGEENGYLYGLRR